jgi:ADP-ribose pyrophosphatase YjhB (NUDIX family)
VRRYPTQPQIGIGVVLLRGEEVLLVQRGQPPAAGAWSLPGGRQELGETAEDCARRELLEETGLTAGPLRLIGHVDSIHRDAEGKIEYHYTILDFAGDYAGGEAAPGDDVSAVVWATAQEFDHYDLWAPAREMIARAKKIK